MSFEAKLKIYCIDDDPDVLEIVTRSVSTVGFAPVGFTSPLEALKTLERDLDELIMIICDFKMPEMNGLELRAQTMERTKNVPFVVLSGYISRDDALQAVNLKLSGFVDKPINEAALRGLISKESAEIVKSLKDEHEMVVAFLGDAETLVEQLEDRLLELDSHPANLEILNQVFAVAHTIKGGSGFIRPETLHHFMHRFEDFLAHYKRSALPLDREGMSVLMRGFDVIKGLVGELKTGSKKQHDLEELSRLFDYRPSDAPKVTGKSKPLAEGLDGAKPGAASHKKEDVRVSTALLDKFMGLSGEITVIRNMINKLVVAIEKDIPGNKDIQLLSELLEEMHKINSVMQDNIIDLRKVPLKSVFRPLPRALRDVAVVLGKEIRLEITGEELRVDNSLAEVLGHSLIHMVRNGADHAIEATEVRRKNGKPEQGVIRLSAAEQGEFVVVTIEDDGKGIDHEVIKAKALSSQLITVDEARKMSPAEIRLLIFHSGFSTAAQVTDISGRGVGMDMVMKEVTRIGGRIEIDSVVGRGSKFQLILPMPKTVNIISALLVRSGAHTFCLPQDDVFRLLSIPVEELATQIRHTDGADFLSVGRELYPLVNLRETLEGKAGCREATTIEARGYSLDVVLLRVGGLIYGLVVEEVLDIEDIVVKGLGRHLRSLGVFAGATFLGDGLVGMILKPEGIALANRLKLVGAKEAAGVADSIDPAGAIGSTGKTEADARLRELVVFELRAAGVYGVYLDDVFRLEHFSRRDVQYSGGQAVVIYRGVTMPLVDLGRELELCDVSCLSEEGGEIPALVVRNGESWVGFAVESIVDLQLARPADTVARDREGILGVSLLDESTVTIINVPGVLASSLGHIRVSSTEEQLTSLAAS